MPHALNYDACRELVEEWLHRTESPAYGHVSRLGSVRVSPDGATVAGIGTILTGIAEPARSALCLVDVSRGDLTLVDLEPQSVAWAGHVVAVGSGTSVVICDEKGRQAHRVQLPGRVENVAGARSGRHVLAVVAPAQDDHYDLSPATGCADTAPLAFLGNAQRPRELVVIDTVTGQHRTLDGQGRNIWEASWIDDDSVVAVISDRPGEGAWYDAYLAVIDTDNGTIQTRYRPVDRRQLSCPVSVDGHLLVIESISSDRGVVAGDVIRVDPWGESVRLDTENVDVSCLSSAGDAVGYVGLRGLTTVAGTIDAATGRCRPLWSGSETLTGWTPEGSVDVDGRIYGIAESFHRYPRLVRIHADRVHTVHDLSHPGAEAHLAAGQRLRSLSWPAPDGLTIEGLLVLPAGQGPFPLLLNVHGGPVSAWRNRWGMAHGTRHPYAGLLAELGVASLHVNPRGSLGRGQDFIDRVRGDMVGLDVEDLMSGVDRLIEEALVDGTRMAVTGNSYGGLMSAWLAARSTRFAAAIPTSPVVDCVSQHYTSNIPEFDELFLQDAVAHPGGEYWSRSPLTHIDGATTPTLLTAGLLDKTTPPDQAVMFHQALRRKGVPTELVLYPRQGHGVSGFPDSTDFLAHLLKWLSRYIGLQPARGRTPSQRREATSAENALS
ncbi:alpha/beta hydrolase family protein [Nocardioides sp. BYT-33-1]|uniref:alpha/beta hydrolase family protein n=1 Tax=Nocardioides sp. BYT-33-1 TaxID=3416952 RepID=UPI003F53BD39